RQASFLEPGVGVEPTSATTAGVYYGLLRGESAAPRPERTDLGGPTNPGLVWPPAKNDEPAANRISLMKRPTNSLGSAGKVNRIQRLSRLSPQSFIGRSPEIPKSADSDPWREKLVWNRRGQKDRGDRGTSPENHRRGEGPITADHITSFAGGRNAPAGSPIERAETAGEDSENGKGKGRGRGSPIRR